MKIICPIRCDDCDGSGIADVSGIEFTARCKSKCGGTWIAMDEPIEVLINKNAEGPAGVSVTDFFALDHENGRITFKCDADMAKEFVFVFSSMLDVAHHIRSKIIHGRAIAAANDDVDRKKRQGVFIAESLKVFNRYSDLRSSFDGDKKKAFKEVQNEFKLKYGETKILLIEGRRECLRLREREKNNKEIFWCWEIAKYVPCPLQGKISSCILSLNCGNQKINFHVDHDKAS